MTLETCDQSDEETCPNQFSETFQIFGNLQICGKFSNFRKMFRFSKKFQIFGKFTENFSDLPTNFRFSDFWKIFRFSENLQICGKCSDFRKIFRFAKKFRFSQCTIFRFAQCKKTKIQRKRQEINIITVNVSKLQC